MKNALSILFTFLAIHSSSQNLSLLLKMVNQYNEPLPHHTFKVKNSSDGIVVQYSTSSKGKAKVVLKRRNTYLFEFIDSTINFEFEALSTSPSFVTKKVQLNTSKGIEVGNKATKDTIIFSNSTPMNKDKSKAEISIKLMRRNKKAITNTPISLVALSIHQVFISETNSGGVANFVIPRGVYSDVFVNGEALNQKVVSPQYGDGVRKVLFYEPLLLKEEVRGDSIFQIVDEEAKATQNRALITITVIDLNREPLSNERVSLASLNDSSKVYYGCTNEDGEVRFLLPKTTQYSLSFKYDKNIDLLKYKNDGAYTRTQIEYSYLGSERIERRKKERERRLAIRDSIYEASLKHEKYTYPPFEEIEKRALEIREKAVKDQNYFQSAGMTVCAVLQRHPEWNNKGIVTDITGSMRPYYYQVALWHAMKLIDDPGCHYSFFNDGDNKSTDEKVIGSTGGIYSCDGDIKTLIKTIKKGTFLGGGGDGPENDIEGLLEEAKRKELGELILVADNYSDVRDIELISKLNIPVRIIVCGATDVIHEHYLQLAYATGGSIHTLEADYFNLKNKIKDNSIKIGSTTYLFNRGGFIKQE